MCLTKGPWIAPLKSRWEVIRICQLLHRARFLVIPQLRYEVIFQKTYFLFNSPLQFNCLQLVVKCDWTNFFGCCKHVHILMESEWTNYRWNDPFKLSFKWYTLMTHGHNPLPQFTFVTLSCNFFPIVNHSNIVMFDLAWHFVSGVSIGVTLPTWHAIWFTS